MNGEDPLSTSDDATNIANELHNINQSLQKMSDNQQKMTKYIYRIANSIEFLFYIFLIRLVIRLVAISN